MRAEDLEISPPVARALGASRPVLALESTLISHGLPWPVNLEEGRKLEKMVLEAGVTPATVGVIDGQVRAGLSDENLEALARKGRDCRKLSSFDIPWSVARKETASTTVAGTMEVAVRAGIQVFATGGIGGVHRDHHLIPDISHDLECLARLPVVVVSAGAKAILDLPATVEYLETKGVLTVGYGCDEFPAFYYRNSGLKLSYRVDSPEEIAELFRHMKDQSLLVVNPVPEKEEISRDIIEPAISQALEEAAKRGVSGKQLTPWLLQKLNELTDGKSVTCNLSLVRNNVRLGTEVAKCLAAK